MCDVLAAVGVNVPLAFTACLAPLRGTQLAVMPYRDLSTSAQPPPAPAPVRGSMPPAVTGGRVNNAVEYVVTKLDDLVNYARKVSIMTLRYLHANVRQTPPINSMPVTGIKNSLLLF